jgi:TetR/AcrR family transcriptional regulator, transcriptional repressor for nem operon
MPTTSAGGETGTSTRILDAAERIVQVRGFNAFSYGDIAGELQITTAALHYHYPRKAELGQALIARYSARFRQRLRALDAAGGVARAKLDGYIGLHAEVLRQGRMCLCGMLAAEYQTLSAPMQAAVRDFFDHNEHWLSAVLEQGLAEGSVRPGGAVTDTARMIVSGVSGAMLIATAYGDVERYLSAAASLMSTLYLVS